MSWFLLPFDEIRFMLFSVWIFSSREKPDLLMVDVSCQVSECSLYPVDTIHLQNRHMCVCGMVRLYRYIWESGFIRRKVDPPQIRIRWGQGRDLRGSILNEVGDFCWEELLSNAIKVSQWNPREDSLRIQGNSLSLAREKYFVKTEVWLLTCFVIFSGSTMLECRPLSKMSRVPIDFYGRHLWLEMPPHPSKSAAGSNSPSVISILQRLFIIICGQSRNRSQPKSARAAHLVFSLTATDCNHSHH